MSTSTGSRAAAGITVGVEWVFRLAVVNLFWIAAVLAGGVVLGIAPATRSLYVLIAEFLDGRSPRIWKRGFAEWRASFWSSQIPLGLPLVTLAPIGVYLAISGGTIFALGTTVVAVMYLVTVLYLPAIMSRNDFPPTTLWLAAVLTAWRRPTVTIVVTIGLAAICIGGVLWTPAAIPFYVPSLPALIVTIAFRRIVRR